MTAVFCDMQGKTGGHRPPLQVRDIIARIQPGTERIYEGGSKMSHSLQVETHACRTPRRSDGPLCNRGARAKTIHTMSRRVGRSFPPASSGKE